MKGKPPPVVTGLSPKEGVPGTQIVIRGENLGLTHTDVVGLYICGTDCLMSVRWESAHKIIARCGQAKGGLGEVVLTTRSGGKGTSTVMFRVYTIQIGPLQESAVWIDECRTVPGREVAGAATAVLVDDDPLGICDERDDFDDMKTGLAYMQRQSGSMREGPKDLLTNNLYSFLSCVDSLAAMKIQLEHYNSAGQWPPTTHLQQQGDYGVILNDYTRAKSLFAETEIPLFKEALEEVEKEMSKFQESLNQKLVEMPSTLAEQKKIIRYLLMLEPDWDPGWDCISAHFHWIQGILWDSQEKHWKHAKRESVIAEADSDFDDKLSGGESSVSGQRYVFLENIILELSTKLQHFWKLGQAYVNGQLTNKHYLHREEEIEQMVGQIVNLCCWLILNALLPESLPENIRSQYGDRFVSWPVGKQQQETLRLLQGLRDIRALINTLYGQEFKENHLHHLMELCVSIRLKCLSKIIDRAVDNIADLHTKENWKIQRQEADYSKTQLPDLFEAQISEILPYIRQILSHNSFPGERDLFSSGGKQMETYLMDTFQRLIGSFTLTLQRAARLAPSVVPPKHVEGGSVRPGNLTLDNTTGSA